VPRALPAEAQPGDRPADALARGLDLVDRLRVALQQRRCPHRGAVAIGTRVVLDDGVDERSDDPQGGRGPPTAGGVAPAGRGVPVGALSAGGGPSGDGARLDTEELSDPEDGLPLMGPHQSLSTAELLGVMGMVPQVQ
jgi:hypothetical protein